MTHEDCIAFFRRVKGELAFVVQSTVAVGTQSELVFAFFVVFLLLLLVGEVAACVAVPVSVAIGVGVFHTVSEIADTFTECSVTECELCVWVVAFCRGKSDVDENASLVVCEG